LLARAPQSGYDLIQHMEEPIGFFWHARRSQIYPELARLEEARLVTHTTVVQRDRPAKKVYEITEAGRAALREWVVAPLRPAMDRDELMLKTYSVWLADPEHAIALFRAQEQFHLDRLAQYELIAAKMEGSAGADLLRHDAPRFAAYATLQRGIAYERGYADWCRWMATMLEDSSDSPR
jgi:DNA-binding PadR family transcriptional regulator